MEAGRFYFDDRPNGGIIIGTRQRNLDSARVDLLAKSMAALGLQTPITVWVPNDQDVHLIAGAHRLAAALKLGWDGIDCVYTHLSEIDRKRWELAENLHRAELTVQERADHLAEWVRLTEQKQEAEKKPEAPKKEDKPRQAGGVSKPKGGRGKKAGVLAASRELGVSEGDARRAIKIAENLTPEAKDTAREVGLDDNQSALLKAADAPKEHQPEVLRALAEKKKDRSLQRQPLDRGRIGEMEQRTPAPLAHLIEEAKEAVTASGAEGEFNLLVGAWEAASEEARSRFLNWIPSRYRDAMAA